MSSSEQEESYMNLSNIELIEEIKYPDRASKIIWSINSNNILQVSSEIIELIQNNKITVQMVRNLLEKISYIRRKDINLFAELYVQLLNGCPQMVYTEHSNLSKLIYYKRHKSDKYNSEVEEVLNLYPKDSPLYYIAWDKVDDLKTKFPNLDVNKNFHFSYSSLDCALEYGSELCFNYLRNLGAKYNQFSESYAVKGGNINIMSQMLEDGLSFYCMIDYALNYHNFEIAEYLRSNLGQYSHSISGCMNYGNFDFASYLLSNGADVDRGFNFFLFISIFVL